MKSFRSRCWLIILAAYWPTNAAAADEPALTERSGAALMRIWASRTDDAATITFTDELKISFEVEGNSNLEVRPPRSWVQGAWRVSRLGEPRREPLAAGRIRWSLTLWLEPLAAGDLTLQLEPLRYRERGGDEQVASWRTVAIKVTRTISEPDLKSLRDIASIETLPAPSTAVGTGWVWTAVACLLVVLAATWHVLGKRRGPIASLSLEHRTLAELSRLQVRCDAGGNGVGRLPALIALVLRRYLDKRFQARARRQTTREFLADVAQQPPLAEEREWLTSFLGRCDLLKFAPTAATLEECRRLIQEVRAFVRRHEASEAK